MKPDLLVGIRNGLNALAHDPALDEEVPESITVEYGALHEEGTEYSPYSYPDNDESMYPNRRYKGPRMVVRSTQQDMGEGHPRKKLHYRYENGRIDRWGRGWLGFSSHSVEDRVTQESNFYAYDNTTFLDTLNIYPFVGRRKFAVHVQGNPHPTLGEDQALRSRSSRSYTSRVTQLNTLELLTEREEEHAVTATLAGVTLRELSHAIRRLSYDHNGNVKNITRLQIIDKESWTALYEKTAFHGYLHDEEQWITGRPQLVERYSPRDHPHFAHEQPTITKSIQYDERGVINRVQRNDRVGDHELTTSYSFDSFGNILVVTNSTRLGGQRVEHFFYDDNGQYPIRTRNSIGHTNRYLYSSEGLLQWHENPNQLVTRFEYDAFNRPMKTRFSDGAEVTSWETFWSSNGVARLKLIYSERGGAIAEIFCDRLGRPILEQIERGASEWVFRTTAYDAEGRLATQSQPFLQYQTVADVGQTEITYDFAGRQKSITLPNLEKVKYWYDGREVTIVDPKGYKTVTKKDMMGRVRRVRDAAGTELAYSYAYGRYLSLIRDAEDQRVLYSATYSPRGERLDVTTPAAGTYQFKYNDFGDMTHQVHHSGDERVITYDLLGRPLVMVDADGKTTYTWDTKVNGVGQLGSITSPFLITTSYNYDEKGRLRDEVQEVAGHKYKTTYGYDGFSRFAGYRVNRLAVHGVDESEHTVRYEYDAYGVLNTVRLDGAPVLKVEGYDAAGRAMRLGYGEHMTADYRFDAKTGFLQRQWLSTTSAPIRSISYSYDANGNMKTRTGMIPGEVEFFEYDELNRLVAHAAGKPPVSQDTYRYDRWGNITERAESGSYAYAADNPFAVTEVDQKHYGYDEKGQQTERPGERVTYTAFGLPRTIEVVDPTVPHVLEFTYDGHRKKVEQKGTDGQVTYIKDVYERREREGRILERFTVAAPGLPIGVLEEETDPSGTREVTFNYLLTDGTDSLIAKVNELGSELTSFEYTPFGEARGSPSDTLSFGGHRSIKTKQGKLLDMGGRWYDPELGRFLTPDPILQNPTFSQNLNAYTYVYNNPLTFTDSTGFTTDDGYPKAGPGVQEVEFVEPDVVEGRVSKEVSFEPESVNGKPESSETDGITYDDSGYVDANDVESFEPNTSVPERTLSSYLPLAQTGDESMLWWVRGYDEADDVLSIIFYGGGGLLNSLWTTETAGDTLLTLIPAETLALKLAGKIPLPHLSRILSRASSSRKIASWFEDIARQATRNPESTKLVLGKFLEGGKSYTKVAAHYKASYFKIENLGAGYERVVSRGSLEDK